MDKPVMLTVEQVAEKLGISKFRVYRRIHRGDIPSVPARTGNSQYLVRAEDLDAYIAAGQDRLPLTPPTMSRDLMSTAEVAIATGWSVETIRKMCYEGRLPYQKGATARGHLRIPRTAVEEMLHKQGIY